MKLSANPRRPLTLLLALLFGACACMASDPPGPSTPTIEVLKQEIARVLRKDHVPGVGLALVAKDRIMWAGGVGKADLASGRNVEADTLFRAGSITKGFVVLALLKLQQDGKIDLNAKLEDVVPEVPVDNPWSATHPVRIVNLLEHTAGFDDMHPRAAYNVHDPPDFPFIETFKRYPEPFTVRWPPGTIMSYSNPDYGVAGYLIEKASGERFGDYIREAVFAPLGMSHSSLYLTDDARARLAQGYYSIEPPRPAPYKEIYYRSSGDLMTSPAELARFVRMLLNRGQVDGLPLLKPEAILRMEYPQTTSAAKAGLKNGYGLANYVANTGPWTAHGHNGEIDGFSADYRYLPDKGVGYVMLFNSDALGAAGKKVGELMLNFLLAGQKAQQQPAMAMSQEQLSRFAGYYEPQKSRNQLLRFLVETQYGSRVTAGNGVLDRENGLFGPDETLVPVAADQFRKADEQYASTIFFTADDGRQIMGDSRGGYAAKISPLWPWTRLGLLILAALVMATFALLALARFAYLLLKQQADHREMLVLALPFVAILLLVLVVRSFLKALDVYDGERTFATMTVWLGTWAFGLLSAASLLVSLRSLSAPILRLVRIHSLLVSVALCGFTLYLMYWHLFGLRFWAY
jgi:CubicO group peptidase (beta-lactamase class C family)